MAISHEPWGEAIVTLPGTAPVPAFEILNPRIGSGTIRFITADVAVAAGTWTFQEGATTQTIPLLFVMKKESDGRKIASLRVLRSF